MTIARSQLVDPQITRWYHCITRCVRRAFLLSEGLENRKLWIEQRLEHLSGIFAVSVGGFAVMDNHLHVLVRLDPERVDEWSNEEVARRWGKLFPPRGLKAEVLEVSDAWVEDRLKHPEWILRARERLSSLSWFMKSLKEPLSRMVNREEQARGAFFEARFKSVAILDEEALLATCAYIDLNPVAAGVADRPEAAEHTSIKQRVEHAEAQDATEALRAAELGSVAACAASSGVEDSHWLCPIEDRREENSLREGMLEGFSLGSYLLLVDYTGRLFRQGKARISAALASVFDRLGTDGETWGRRLKSLRRGHFQGRVFATSKERLSVVKELLGLQRLPNLRGSISK